MESAASRALGPAAVVPFEARRLARARVVLLDRGLLDLADEAVLERFAWAVPGARDPDDMFLPRSRTLHAERYGGEGLGFHGGGVRVGCEAELQVKGIGRNPLAGEGSLADYAHGGMSLFEGIQEAVWGEVLARALPHGAVRAPAVLATGSACWWVIDRWGKEALRGRYGADVHLPRGLLVRESPLRPAHFERAVMHRPPAGLAATMAPDAARVRQAVLALPGALPLPAPEAARLPPVERLRMGALEMARRFAEQGAAAKSKRLVHGNISPSNICLDGRWIDFGSVTALPGWGEIDGYGPFWDDSALHARMYATLCFNLRKYFPAGGAALPELDELVEEHLRVHAAWLERRFLGLAGLPFELTSGAAAADRTRLFRTLVMIARLGHGDPVFGHPDDDSSFGTYRLGAILLAIARWWGTPSLDARVAAHLASDELRGRLIAAYEPVRRQVEGEAARRDVSPAALRRLIVLGAARTARTIPHLYRARMVEHTEAMVLGHRDLDALRAAAEAWRQELSDQASVVYEDPAGLVATVWRRGAAVVRYDARRGAFSVGVAGGERVVPAGASARPPVLDEALDSWGDEVKEAIA